MSTNISNMYNIPISLAVFFAGDDYDGYNDDPYNISVTTLLKSTRQIVLQKRLPDNLVKDISENIRSRLGQAYHKGIEDSWLNEKLPNTLERLGLPKRIRERIVINPTEEELKNNPDLIPCYFEIRTEKKVGKWTITGKFDQVIAGTLEDNKSTGVYAYLNQSNTDKWTKQGSYYRWLNPDIVTEDYMVINYLFTDWSGGRAKSDKSYPNLPIAWQKYELMSLSAVDQMVRNKLKEVEKYLNKPEQDLPECTDEDLWRGDTVYKYYSSSGNTRSSKNFKDRFEAETHVLSKGKGYIETVPGEVVACKYCPAFSICSQKDKYIKSGELKL